MNKKLYRSEANNYGSYKYPCWVCECIFEFGTPVEYRLVENNKPICERCALDPVEDRVKFLRLRINIFLQTIKGLQNGKD